jgi:hypothetical protein
VVFSNEISCAESGAATPVCLMVGAHYSNPKSPAQLAELWSAAAGSPAWSIIASFTPPGTGWSSLNDVSCPTTTFCLAVGQAGNGSSSHPTAYTLTISGGTPSWHPLAVPGLADVTSSGLGSLTCTDATHCVANGIYHDPSGHWLAFAAEWQAGTWTEQPMADIAGASQTVPNAVACPTPTSCIAVGASLRKAWRPFVEAGTNSGGVWTWKWVPSAYMSDNASLFSVSCPTAGQCFASGYYGPNGLLESWQTGLGWRKLQAGSTSPNDQSLQHVSCVSATSCIAAGYRYNPKNKNYLATLIELWDGHVWTVKASPNV